ncbi:hypothetical protein ACOSQ4_000560 [Xanthoceras sorbifolium]
MLLLISFNLCTVFDCQLNDSNQYKVAYTIVVDQYGHGNFTNIQNAIDSLPSGNTQWIRIQISSGKYWEKVTMPKQKPCIFLEGAGSGSTSIEWDDHVGTSTSATFTVYLDNIAVNISEQTQAVAAITYGDKSVFYQCSFIGLQDCLYDARGRHYFSNCYIEGGMDFIFGSGQSIYEHPSGYITAQGRNSSADPSGFVFKTCTITGTGKAYLVRAYGAYSRVIFANSTLSDTIVPQGWSAWHYVHMEQNIEYMVNGCSGPGADTSKRVSWEKKPNSDDLNSFVNISFIDGEGWI